MTTPVTLPAIVDQRTWDDALAQHRADEKAVMRRVDVLAASRRRLPMVELPAYSLRGERGDVPLVDVFEGRSQLVTYHFMWNPGATDQCGGCTFFTSHISTLEPLHARDTTFAIVTVGAWDEAAAYRDRFGWTMPWYSSADSEFGADMGSGPGGGFGLNEFVRDGDRVFRTYHTSGRGSEPFVNTWAFLDLTAFGRQESWQDVPAGRPKTDPYRWWPDPADFAAEHRRDTEARPLFGARRGLIERGEGRAGSVGPGPARSVTSSSDGCCTRWAGTPTALSRRRRSVPTRRHRCCCCGTASSGTAPPGRRRDVAQHGGRVVAVAVPVAGDVHLDDRPELAVRERGVGRAAAGALRSSQVVPRTTPGVSVPLPSQSPVMGMSRPRP